MPRQFLYDGRIFPDPNPDWSVEDVRQSMSHFLPELANAETIGTKSEGNDVFEFRRRTGTKGNQGPEGDRCYINSIFGPGEYCPFYDGEVGTKPRCKKYNVPLSWVTSGGVLKCAQCLKGE